MRIASVLATVVALGSVATADDKAFEAYAGQIVISPDPTPTTINELPAYLKANATKDGHYELIKGPPWEIHLVGFLSKDPGTSQLTLTFTDTADKKGAPIQAIDVSSRKRMVIARTTATVAAGFEENKTYLVTLVQNKTVLAKAELKLRN